MGELTSNIDTLIEKISEIGKSISTPIPVQIPDNVYLSDDDCLAQMITNQSADENSDGNKLPLEIPENIKMEGQMDAKDIAKGFPTNHPTREFIKEKRKDVKVSIDQLGVKAGEIVQSTVQLTTETVAAFITIGTSATIMPFGAGLPTAFSALQGIFSNLEAFQTKINQLTPILSDLKYFEILVDPDSDTGKSAINTINGALGSIKNSLNGVEGVTSTAEGIKSALGGMKAPGSSGIPGITSPPEEIQWDSNPIWGTKNTLTQAQVNAGGEEGKVWINCSPTKGTWQYKFWWSSDNDPGVLNKNVQSVVAYPQTTTKYTVMAQNKDEPDSKKIWAHWTVTVS